MRGYSYLKTLIVIAMFAISFVGFTVTTSTKKIGGESVNVSLVTLGTKAQAYCNERTYFGEENTGICTGDFNQSSSSCRAKLVDDPDPNCVR